MHADGVVQAEPLVEEFKPVQQVWRKRNQWASVWLRKTSTYMETTVAALAEW